MDAGEIVDKCKADVWVALNVSLIELNSFFWGWNN